jgi:hypothetical protein
MGAHHCFYYPMIIQQRPINLQKKRKDTRSNTPRVFQKRSIGNEKDILILDWLYINPFTLISRQQFGK